ncbi:tRNA (guanine-N(7)-)-methyltransferase [Clostridia bacterium]|nr:tRNA (guanine-N(7)-)-methyltransferase [Clostridia bacterium]
MRMRRKRNLDARLAACESHILCRLYAETATPADNIRVLGGGVRRVLELGCGKGAFASCYAARNADTEVYAVEKDMNVLVSVLETISLQNLRFIAGDALYLPRLFGDGTVDTVYLNFSTPFPKAPAQRLTHERYLAVYRALLKPGGTVELKTDNDDFFDYSAESLSAGGFEIISMTRDLHRGRVCADNSYDSNDETRGYNCRYGGNIITEYERKFMSAGITIKQLRAVLL